MSKRVQFVSQPYARLIEHSFMYQDSNVFGLLLGKTDDKGYLAEDYIPISHSSQSFKPLAEVALDQVATYSNSKNYTVLGAYYSKDIQLNSGFSDFLKLASTKSSDIDAAKSNGFDSIVLSINPDKLSNISKEVILDAYTLTKDQLSPIELNNSEITAKDLEEISKNIKHIGNEDSRANIWDFESSFYSLESVNWLGQSN